MNTSFSKGSSGTALKERIRNFYDSGSQLYLDVYGQNIHDGYYVTGNESGEEAQVNLIKLMAEKADIQRGSKILDVGCGVGGSSLWLSKNLDAITTGITISPVQVQIARELANLSGANSSFMVMDAENVDFDQKFDVIWVAAAITHFPEQEEFIQSVSRYLNPKGKFVIFDWMASGDIDDVADDIYLRQVSERMLVAGLFSLDTYTYWFKNYGYIIRYTEDITTNTIQTWSDAFSQIKRHGALKLLKEAAKHPNREIFGFLLSFGSMKRAIQKGRLKAGIIVAEKC